MAGFATPSAQAQADPPGRVGRLADLQGGVSWFDHERGQWSEAERNRPLTGGDRLSTGPQGRAELRIGSTVLRLGSGTELEVLRLDDDRLRFQLHSGSLGLRVRSREVAGEIDIVTAEALLQPLRSGHYRIDRIDDTTHAGSWRGELRVDDANGFVISAGQRSELWREGPSRELRQAWNSLPDDSLAQWAVREDQRDERSAASRYVSPEMTGAEELDRSGRWDRHPDYGAIWYPLEVRAGWAPYRYGRWAWVQPWGWTWVDEAAWGFAQFHYGRWLHWGGHWGWVPGVYVPRPVFAPALVAWVGGAHWGVSVNIGGPTVGWLPLAPREVFVPHYHHTPYYGDRVNAGSPHHPHRPYVPYAPRGGHGPQPPVQVPTGPIMYGNQGVPGAVTVVSRDALMQRQPVSRAVVAPHAGQRSPTPVSNQPLLAVAPPQGPPVLASPVAPGQQLGPARPRPQAQAPIQVPVQAPREINPPLQMVPGGAAQVGLPPERNAIQAPPPRRIESGQVIDLRRERGVPPAPAVIVQPAPQFAPPVQGSSVHHARPPAAAAVAAPVSPPTVAVAPAAAPAMMPAGPARPGFAPPTPPQVQQAPQAQPKPRPAEQERASERDDERKRVPESRHNQRGRENLR